MLKRAGRDRDGGAVQTVREFLAAHPELAEVRLVCFSEASAGAHLSALAARQAG